jgi:hypothetical protein
MPALLGRSWTVFSCAVVGSRAVCLYFLQFLSSGDDHIAGIAPNIDDLAKIAVGVVVVVALLFLMVISYALASPGSLLVANTAAFILIFHHRLVFQLDGNRHRWWS